MHGKRQRHNAADLPGHDGSSETAGEPLQQFRGKFGRYLDIDDDGIPYRTIPGTHTTYGAFVTRGSSRDEYAVYTEDGDAYRRNVDRPAAAGPQPEFFWNADAPVRNGRDSIRDPGKRSSPSGETPLVADEGVRVPFGVIFFGTSTYAAEEAIELLGDEGIKLDAMRVRGFPFGKSFVEFVNSHQRLFVIEQNRDTQFKSLMMIELGVDPHKLVSVLDYDGTPITADDILKQIKGSWTR